MNKKVLLFGIYNPELALNRVLLKGFERNGFNVVECRVDPRDGRFVKYWRLWRLAQSMRHEKFTYVVVGVPGQAVVWIARLVFGRPVILDACHSIYDANVIDRKLYGRWSLRGIRDRFLDWYSVRLADVVLLHTKGTVDYFVEEFNTLRSKCRVLYTGADETLFYPREAAREKQGAFYVHFHAVFTPVQGVDNILDAAHFLRDEGVVFHIVGYGGALYRKIEERVKKEGLHDIVHLEGRKPYVEMPNYIARADVCIGTFGDTPKARFMSVPTKVFEYVAMRKPVISGDTAPIRELFTDRKDMLLARLGDGRDLANKIRDLRDNEPLRNSIAEASHRLFKEKLTYSALIKELMVDLPKQI